MASEHNYSIIDSGFCSSGLKCAGTLYLPDKPNRNLPAIILGHGFAAERKFRLPAFADRFARMGLAAYFFDYRSFGDSDGEPRHLVSSKRHQEDWHKAIAHVRGMIEIDPKRIAIWGSSLSGGHVLQIAAESEHVAAVISQVPHVDGLATMALVSPLNVIKASIAGARDLLSSRMTGQPFYSPVIGKPEEFAAMNSAEVWDGWTAMMPEGSTWKNQVQARIFLELPFYNPIKFASKITVPTLVIAGENDTVTPAKAAQKAARKIKNSEFHLLKCNHFQAYVGDHFEENIGIQTDFLQRHLLAKGS